jgi:hypothetical protein
MHECNAACPPDSFERAKLVFSIFGVHYMVNRRECGAGEGHMDELVGRIVANVGVDRTVAEKAVGIILQFLLKEGPADKVRSLIEKLPGADAAIQAAPPDSGSGGIFGGGVMAAGSRMMSLGLSMGQVQAVTRETIVYAREKVGDETLSEIGRAIPGLSQFV